MIETKTETKLVWPPEVKREARNLWKKSRKKLGCSEYLAHMTVSYLDIHPYCFYCGLALTWHSATIEHLVPKSEDPARVNKPKVLSCEPCNQQRSSKPLEKWLLMKRPIVDPEKAGYPFWKEVPQNAFHYIGQPVPEVVIKITEETGRSWGLLG